MFTHSPGRIGLSGVSRHSRARRHAATEIATNISADLKSPTQPKGFPHGLTDEEKELIMEDARRTVGGMGRDFAESMGRIWLKSEQSVRFMWSIQAMKKPGKEWVDACEADESILYYAQPQPNYDKWYTRLCDRETVVRDNGMYEITTITEYAHEAEEYRASKKMPAGATGAEWAGRKYNLHYYSPTNVDSTKEIAFDLHLECLWGVVEAGWNVMCDEVDVPADADVRRFLYRPGQIMCMSEPECWDDENRDPEDREYDRKTTIEAARQFAGSLLGLMMDDFEGSSHVRERCNWPKYWRDKRKDEYSKVFEDVVEKQCEIKDGRSWNLIPILHDKRTRVTDVTVDRIGGFLID